MPNRIIKESICSSDSIDGLSWFEECFFYRLIVNCDDYGRMDARPPILRAKLFPLKTVTDKQVETALQSLRTAAMIDLYIVNGRSYLQLRTWENHQSIRAKRSKFPSPADSLQASEINCKQMQANVPVIQSNPNPNPNPIRESESEGTEPETVSMPPSISLTLNTGAEYPIYETQILEWQSLYPAVDIMQELRNMKGWLIANPSKKKTKSGILRFIAGWLSKEQNRGGSKAKAKNSGNIFLDMLKEEDI